MYRDHVITCPSCNADLEDAGTNYRCVACHGVWITEESLTKMIWEIQEGLESVPLQWEPREAPRTDQWACPACGKPMDNVVVEGVAVERCIPHGIWLDPGEHELTLRHAAERPSNLTPGQRRHMNLGHALSQMMERSSTEKGIQADHDLWDTSRSTRHRNK